MKKKTKRLITALTAAALITALSASGLLYRIDCLVSDALYQSPQALDGNIFIVGIDAQSLEELGPFNTWDRTVFADVIEALNGSDPSARPAAIGIDVLFAGETDPKIDSYLAQAAEEGGNVVAACAVNFTSAFVETEDGGGYMTDYFIESVDYPFDGLESAAEVGHINSMYDADGFLRHQIFKIDLPDGESLASFSYLLACKYAEANGLDAPKPPPTDARGNWYLPYTGGPGTFECISLCDVLSGEVGGDYFADSVVIIGPYATGLMDTVYTAADHAQIMYGTEYHANAVNALLLGEYKTELPQYLQLALLFVISFFFVLLFSDRRIWSCVLIWLLGCGAWLGLALLAYSLGTVISPLYAPIAITLIFIGSVAANYMRAAAEKRRVRETFGRYVDPSIIKELMKEDSDSLGLGGKLCDIAVLFVDIRGFTSMSEVLTPPQVVEILNQYLSLTTDCVLKNHGTLDKFVGDCTMAIWNAPLEQDDYIMNACRAALDMVEGSKPLAEKLQREFGRSVAFGVGVHCGAAVVGNIGAEIRMDYTAIGDTVNTAARLEANAPGGKIYISRAVADALSGRIKTTSLGDTIKLKGKAEGFEILTLDGLA